MEGEIVIVVALITWILGYILIQCNFSDLFGRLEPYSSVRDDGTGFGSLFPPEKEETVNSDSPNEVSKTASFSKLRDRLRNITASPGFSRDFYTDYRFARNFIAGFERIVMQSNENLELIYNQVRGNSARDIVRLGDAPPPGKPIYLHNSTEILLNGLFEPEYYSMILKGEVPVTEGPADGTTLAKEIKGGWTVVPSIYWNVPQKHKTGCVARGYPELPEDAGGVPKEFISNMGIGTIVPDFSYRS